MNCNRFRFLIQQRFDTEISPQDDRALLMHLETCDSCQKFHHQVQQVILAAEELPIQDDLLPVKLESLARRIMEQLPQPKQNLLDTVRGFLQNLGSKKNGSEKLAGPVRPTRTAPQKPASPFPHINRQPSVELDEDLPNKKISEEQLQEMRANSGRLKAINKGYQDPTKNIQDPSKAYQDPAKAYQDPARNIPDPSKGYQDPSFESRELQSTTRSLSEKFSPRSAMPNSMSDEQPLNLADAIRRKRTESQRQTHDPQAIEDAAAKAKEVDIWGGSTSLPGVPAQMPPQIPPGRGTNSSLAMSGLNPANRSPQPPMDPNNPDAEPGANQGGPSVLGAWGKPSPIDSSQWGIVSTPGMPSPAEQPQPQEYQANAPDSGMGALIPPGQRGAPGSWGSAWGSGPAGRTTVDENSWTAPLGEQGLSFQKSESANKNWETINRGQGLPSSENNNSETANSFTPGVGDAPPPRRPPPSAWGESEPAPGSPVWPERQVPGANGPQSPPQPSWGAAPPSTSAWDPSTVQDKNPAAAWDNALNQAAQKQPPIGSWADTGATTNWQPERNQIMPKVPSTTGGTNNWENLPADRNAEFPGTGGAGDGWGTPGSEPGAPRKTNWSIEAEQIETGTWQAFYPMDNLGTPTTHANWNKGGRGGPQQPGAPQPGTPQPGTLPGPLPGADDLNQEWDIPIQEKLARQRGGSVEPGRAAQAEPVDKGTDLPASPFDLWNKAFPEPYRTSASSGGRPDDVATWPPRDDKQLPLAQPEEEVRHEEPRPRPAFDFATQSLAGLANSVMDKLGSMLGDRHHAKESGKAPQKQPQEEEKSWTPPPDLWTADQLPPSPQAPVLPPYDAGKAFDATTPGRPQGQPVMPVSAFEAGQRTSQSNLRPPENAAGGIKTVPFDLGPGQPTAPFEPVGQPSYPPPEPVPSKKPEKPTAFSQAETSALPALSDSQIAQSQSGEQKRRRKGESAQAAAGGPVSAPKISPVVSRKATGGQDPVQDPAPAGSAPLVTPSASSSELGWQVPAVNQADQSTSQGRIPAIASPQNQSTGQAGIPAVTPVAPAPNQFTSQAGIPAVNPAAVPTNQSSQSVSQAGIPSIILPANQSNQSTSQAGIPAVTPVTPAPNQFTSQAGIPAVPPVTPAPNQFTSQAGIPAVPPVTPAPNQFTSQAGIPAVPPVTPASNQTASQSGIPTVSPVKPASNQATNQAGIPAPNQANPEPGEQPGKKGKNSGLFVFDDKDIDKLFSENLGVNDQAQPASGGARPAEAPPSQAWPPANQSGSTSPSPSQPPSPSWPSQPSNPQPSNSQVTLPPGSFWTPPGAADKNQAATPADWSKGPRSGSEPPDLSGIGAQPPAAASSPEPSAEANKSADSLFSFDSSIIDKIFTENLGVSAQVQAKMPKMNNVNEAVKAISDVAATIPPPKIEGLGRLDSRVDTSNETGSGRITSIGKFLLDGKDLEKIGKLTASDLSETKMRILTLEGAAELSALLKHVGEHAGVSGSVIIGHDGLLIANTMPPDMDAEYFGVMAYTLFMSTSQATAKMGSQRVEQIVAKTIHGYLIIANFGNGLLVTASDVKEMDGLLPLLRSIAEIVAP